MKIGTSFLVLGPKLSKYRRHYVERSGAHIGAVSVAKIHQHILTTEILRRNGLSRDRFSSVKGPPIEYPFPAVDSQK